ncbi:hypothetical protein H5410_031236 [Solanum commersonii]|uniref:Endonuclease/exonuclease/phosphatase domain-containing protein n=1 Tax=Solanum commersonii TaxID=4109 RepID=A0A9J5YHT7_SOLCO|nr:hypothetical protein H5410_031236 [Solanum commersonii]
MEPFQDSSDWERYRRRLGHHTTLVNCSDVIEDSIQQMTLQVVHQNKGVEAMVIIVYVSCNAINREELWNSIQQISSHFSLPWLVGGDFNVILSLEEKLGGLPVYYQETEDFANCIATIPRIHWKHLHMVEWKIGGYMHLQKVKHLIKKKVRSLSISVRMFTEY